MAELVGLGAAFAVNCVSSLENYIRHAESARDKTKTPAWQTLAQSGSLAGEVARATTTEAETPSALTVRFEPQGNSSGGKFRLSAGTAAYRVTIDAVTGRVKNRRE